MKLKDLTKTKIRIYFLATRVYDWQIPGISWLADKVRDWSWN